MVKIHVKDYKYKQWKKRNDAKKLKNRIKRNKKRKKYQNMNKHNNIIENLFKVPSLFSIRRNTEETIKFFNDILDHLRNILFVCVKNYTYEYKIDMSETIDIDSDALMYLITVIKKTRINKKCNIRWRGNFPKNENIKNFLKTSGFLKYFKSNVVNIVNPNNKIQITSGTNVDPNLMKSICDFVNKHLQYNKNTKFLYSMLTELMTNTKQHAYNNNSTFDFSWYVFVENKRKTINITFMDNGSGIPSTISKKLSEKFKENFKQAEEHKYLLSALEGKYRSETGEKYRGKGLPEIYEPSQNKIISNLTIISNKAYYSREDCKDIKENIEGSIFYWEIEKGEKE